MLSVSDGSLGLHVTWQTQVLVWSKIKDMAGERKMLLVVNLGRISLCSERGDYLNGNKEN